MRTAKDPADVSKGADWNPGGWTHCDIPPLGLTRFRKEAMDRARADWPTTDWAPLDMYVGMALARAGVRTHIHLPMAHHYHGFQAQDCVHPVLAGAHLPLVGLRHVVLAYREKILALPGIRP